MAKKHHRVFEGDANQNPKGHPDDAPRGRPPTGDTTGRQRRGAAQVTDRGSAGLEKK